MLGSILKGGSMALYQLPDLPYDYNALEPVISSEIMELHHKKHHGAYVNNLNAALEKSEEAQRKGDLAKVISLQAAIRFNGGGHLNHSLFWESLAPLSRGGGEKPEGELMKAFEKEFGQFGLFFEEMSAKTTAIQGSGWGWLGYDSGKKRLVVAATANQDSLFSQGLTPLMGIDVWEHAYYLQYKNARADYVKNIWKIINWKKVSERYREAASS